MPNLYIIAGYNGAGKTTASFTVLPDLLNCNQFVNADNIAAGISPFDPGSVSIEAGRIMLQRIDELLRQKVDFAIETTLSTRSFVSLIKRIQQNGYKVTLLYFWLNSPQMAIERVAIRVSEGGHDIPENVIIRRYYRGIKNLVNLYIPICDKWLIVNNTNVEPVFVAQSKGRFEIDIIKPDIWNTILKQRDDNESR